MLEFSIHPESAFVQNNNLDLKGKKVLLRVDLNVPMKNGAITETSRIEKIIPTIKFLIELFFVRIIRYVI